MKRQEIQKISEALTVLQGAKLAKMGRAGSMAWITFLQPLTNRMYALHIQCHFRICDDTQIILAKGDMYEPKAEAERGKEFDFETFDWDMQGNNLYDEIVNKLLNVSNSEGFIIENVSISKYGDIILNFENDHILEVIIDLSNKNECWRFFEPKTKNTHLVALGICLNEDI